MFDPNISKTTSKSDTEGVCLFTFLKSWLKPDKINLGKTKTTYNLERSNIYKKNCSLLYESQKEHDVKVSIALFCLFLSAVQAINLGFTFCMKY
jgi:hypothetical protein